MERLNHLAVGSGTKLEVWKVMGTEVTVLGWPCCSLTPTEASAKMCLSARRE